MGIAFKELSLNDVDEHFLQHFNRYQETSRVLYLEDGQLKEKDDTFVDQWDKNRKNSVITDIQDCLRTGGTVFGAYRAGKLVAFANVTGEVFGPKNEYVELPYIHVSNEMRGSGIGKTLFKYCCDTAKAMGAEKLYIATHPAVESQAFYQSMGCELATWINQKIYEKQPLDLQLEKIL